MDGGGFLSILPPMKTARHRKRFLSVTGCFIKKEPGTKIPGSCKQFLLGDRFHAADTFFAFCVFVSFGKDLDGVLDFAVSAETFLTVGELHHAGAAADRRRRSHKHRNPAAQSWQIGWYQRA